MPFEASFSTLISYVMSGSEAASVPHASLETNNARESAQSSVLSDTSLSNAEILQLFSQLLDVKFDQMFAAFKCDLEDKKLLRNGNLRS